MTYVDFWMVIVLIICVLITIYNPYRRDADIDRRITQCRKIGKLKKDVGASLTFEDTAINRLDSM